MKLALKRLTRSDLTFFQWQFLHIGAGNQKAINLNSNVFRSQLYPNIDDAVDANGEIGVVLSIFGPAASPEIVLRRKIIKGDTYKNWRLNGEFVFNPEDEPDRFNSLQPDDLVLFGFEGASAPSRIKAVFLAHGASADRQLHRALSPLVPAGSRNSMIALEQGSFESLISSLRIPDEHPVNALLADVDLIDAASGYEPAIEKLRRRFTGRVTKEAVSRAREMAAKTGEDGEDLISGYLASEAENHRIKSFRWIAREFALSPYDFIIDEQEESECVVDVKATRFDFERPFHMSFAELLEADARENYQIYRVYLLNERSGRLRICRNLQPIAREILRSLAGVPRFALVDTVSIRPELLSFEVEIEITLPEE